MGVVGARARRKWLSLSRTTFGLARLGPLTHSPALAGAYIVLHNVIIPHLTKQLANRLACCTIYLLPTLAYNKRAKFDYDLIETYEAGLELLGTEVKSVRAKNVSLKGAFVTIKDNQAWLTNATIPPWQMVNAPKEYDPARPRRLLVKKSELKHFIGAKQQQGLTIIPIRVYSRGPYIKLELALARGKRKFNKKQAKKERDIQRDVERSLRGKE